MLGSEHVIHSHSLSFRHSGQHPETLCLCRCTVASTYPCLTSQQVIADTCPLFHLGCQTAVRVLDGFSLTFPVLPVGSIIKLQDIRQLVSCPLTHIGDGSCECEVIIIVTVHPVDVDSGHIQTEHMVFTRSGVPPQGDHLVVRNLVVVFQIDEILHLVSGQAIWIHLIRTIIGDDVFVGRVFLVLQIGSIILIPGHTSLIIAVLCEIRC